MNTLQLQEKHRNVYKQFFTQHHQVISLAYVFEQEVGLRKQETSSQRAVPLRLYIGIKPHSEPQTSIQTIYEYDPLLDDFHTYQARFTLQECEHITNMITHHIGENWSVSLLLELPRYIDHQLTQRIEHMLKLYNAHKTTNNNPATHSYYTPLQCFLYYICDDTIIDNLKSDLGERTSTHYIHNNKHLLSITGNSSEYAHIVSCVTKHENQHALIFHNHSDGRGEKNLTIEQNIEHGLVHSLFDGSIMQVHDNNGKKSLCDSVYDIIHKYDIIVDKNYGKLYIGGKKVRSSEILSQHYTSNIIEHHITHNSNTIKSTDIPVSSYSKSKSEFLGKIAHPLQRTIQERLGKPLHIQCKGKGSNFDIKLIYDRLAIACIS